LMSTRREDCNTSEQTRQLRREQRAASRISPLLQDHHKLLVTLLLLNSVANEALPIFLDQIFPSWLAVIISVTCVLFFGEILPSAIFTGPSQLPIAAALSPVVRCLQILFMPLSMPIKTLLDKMVGHDEQGPKYTRAELKALIRLHRHDMIGGHDVDCDDEFDYSSGDESSQDGSDLELQPKPAALETSRTRLMQECELEEQTSDNTPRGPSDSGLTMVECTLAEQSLGLSKMSLDSLIAQNPGLLQAVARQDPAEALRISSSTPVSKALAMLHVEPPGRRLLVCESGNIMLGTTTREALLWTSLMSQGFPASRKPPP